MQEYVTEKEKFVNVADRVILQLYEDASPLENYTVVEYKIVFIFEIIHEKRCLILMFKKIFIVLH